MTILQLNLLGTFAVSVQGEAVSQFRSDKIRALLIYLAVESGRPHHREFLAALLWPEMDRADGLRNLRKSLSRLRQTLGKEASDALLVATRQTLAINRGNTAVDVLRFGQMLDGVTAHGHTAVADCPACLQQLEAALALYKGEFLHGFVLADTVDFADWAVVQREKWHQRYLAALQMVTAAYIDRQQWQQALPFAQQQVVVDPWRESAYNQMMQIYGGMGQLDAVRRQYEACRRQLLQELGAVPSAQTEALYAQLMQTAVALTAAPPVAKMQAGLPRQFTSFVGREGVLAEINGRLDNPNCALLTLLGPGGVGKTRVAAEVARRRIDRYRDGVVFVALAAVAEAADVAGAIVDTLDLPRIRKQDSQSLLLRYLREKQLLLVLDNFEHVLSAANVVLTILQEAPQVQILITSRVALNLRAEWLYELIGLRIPAREDAADVASFTAVQLFLARLTQIDSQADLAPVEMTAVARICTLVAGIPLAIELAASQSRLTPIPQVAADLAQSLDALRTEMRDVPPRHRSLRAVFDYSWRSLTALEQDALLRLAVFNSGFSPAAAVAVAAADAAMLDALQDKSFLHKTAVDRYDLHEVLRQYAREKMAAVGAETAMLQQHSQYFLAELGRQERLMLGRQGKGVMAALQRELANILQAWHTACTAGAVADLLRSQFALSQFLYLRGLMAQGQLAFAAGVTAVAPLVSAETEQSPAHLLLVQLLNAHARFLLNQGQVDASEARIREGLERSQSMGYQQEEALAWLQMGIVYMERSEYESAHEMYDRAAHLLAALDDQPASSQWQIRGLQASLYKQKSDAYWEVGNFEEARRCLEASLTLDTANEDLRGEASCYHRLGIIARIQGAYDQAVHYFEQAQALARLVGYSRLQHLLQSSLALTYSDKGDNQAAQRFFLAFYQSSKEMGDVVSQLTGLINLGLVSARLGATVTARSYYEQALQVSYQVKNKRNEGLILGNLGVVTMRLGDFAEARRLFADSLALRLAIQDQPGEMYTRYYMARLALYEGDAETAVAQCQKVLALSAKNSVRNVDNLARTCLGHAYARLGQQDQATVYYAAALAAWQQTGQQHLMMAPLSGLARLALLAGDQAQAARYCDQILEEAADLDLESTFEPFDIWLVCVDVLLAVGDQRVKSVLAMVYGRLQQQTANIPDRDLRAQFLQRIPAHAEIVRLASHYLAQ